jgi:hypothetical protein
MEDQGSIKNTLMDDVGKSTYGPLALGHKPFFSGEVATDLLRKIDEITTHSSSVGLDAEIPLSPDAMRIFHSAKNYQQQFNDTKIEPLQTEQIVHDD